MAKTINANMQTHLAQTVTTLCMLLRVTRRDGTEFYFAGHDQDLVYDGNTYLSAIIDSQTAIPATSTLSVDNLDIVFLIDGVTLIESEVRAGLFDYAEFHLTMVNWADLSAGMGDIKLRRGWLGEVTETTKGVFKAEFRSMSDVLRQVTHEVYQPECRYNLGDSRCGVPIYPDVLGRNAVVALGEFYRVATDPATDFSIRLLVSADGSVEDKSLFGAEGTLGPEAALVTTPSKFGGAIEFSPSAYFVSPSDSYVSFPSRGEYYIGTKEFNIEMWVRYKSLPSAAQQALASQYMVSGTQRAWYLAKDSNGDLTFVYSTNGSSTSFVDAIDGAARPVVDTWYHIAISRDSSNDVRMFVDGVQVNTTTTVTADIFDSSSPILLGKVANTVTTDYQFDGYIDDFELRIGQAVRTSNFTPPSAPHSIPSQPGQSVYEDIIYEVTTAGVTDIVEPSYDPTPDNPTTDGSAVLTARDAFMRDFEVTSVTNDVTFSITVTEARAVDDWFNGGGLTFESGDNAGLTFEIRDWTQSSTEIILYLPTPFTVQAGDTGRLYPGCDFDLDTCIDRFDNVEKFGGEPFLPGREELFARPPSGN